MTYVFLSYAKADRDAAFAMRDVLRREGLSNVWMDENVHELSDEHWPVIESNILSAGAFIVLLSDAAKASKWVQREWIYARQIQKPIYTILIQGEAWSGLQEEPLRPSLGASLDLPDEFTVRIKRLDAPYANLPEQIRSDTVKAPSRPPYKLAISIALILAILLMLARLYNSAIEAAYVASLTSDAEAQQLTDEYIVSHNSTVTARNQLSTRYASMTESYEATDTAQARLSDTEIAATGIAATNTHQASINLTAVAGNGTLPCTATVRMVGSSIRLTVYTAPDRDAISDPLRFSVAYTITLTEWVVNSDGVWYGLRLYPDDLVTYAYIPAEDLILDETCPR